MEESGSTEGAWKRKLQQFSTLPNLTKILKTPKASLPFVVSSDVMRSDREATRKNSCELFDSNSLGNMLLFQYLINVLEGDFLPCINIYKETMNWNLWRECLLNKFLCYLLFLTFLHISLNGLSYFLTESSIWLLMLDLVSFWILLHFRYDAIELTALSIEFKC
ncbi:uncharacterized protein LOC111278157 isoform X2 [Durio zibethinus]|uniref:Uncharacterized protein LOC111278157 isoform X2 n=1 Tax=Durio zibethinus TaxID=66656 RepID=A0A6P5WX36_DURZI|nr:uncharacterized protein LOC111278157 isoform X2 [Durio zibethinus]